MARPCIASFGAGTPFTVEIEDSHCIILVATHYDGRNVVQHRETVTNVARLKEALDLAVDWVAALEDEDHARRRENALQRSAQRADGGS